MIHLKYEGTKTVRNSSSCSFKYIRILEKMLLDWKTSSPEALLNMNIESFELSHNPSSNSFEVPSQTHLHNFFESHYKGLMNLINELNLKVTDFC